MKRRLCLLLVLVVASYGPLCSAASTVRFVINGVSGDILGNVQSRIGLDQNKDLATDDVQQSYTEAKDEIRKAVEPYGYFNPTIQSQIVKVGTTYVATFNINLGHAIKITKLEVNVSGPGQNNVRIQKYLKKFPLHSGDIFQSEAYQSAKERLFQLANDQGYIKSTFSENKVLIDRDRNQAEVIMLLQTGDRYYFGNVTFNDNPYSPAFLQRFITFKQSETFSSKRLIAFQQKLAGSYYFAQVIAIPDFEHIENYHVPIKLTLQAPKSQKYNIGVGYGSFTGPRITAGVNFRRTTNSGQHFEAQMQYSSVLYGLTAKYYIPGKDPLNDQWSLGVNLQKFMPKNGESTSETLSGGYSTKLGNWQTNLSLNYLIERYQIENMPMKNSHLLYPDLNVVYTKTDKPINPSTGLSVAMNLQGASTGLLSSDTFLQGELSGKFMFSPMSFNKVILRGDVGYTVVKDLNALPLTMRFTTGGVSSVRGYDDNSIGPGRYLEVGSIEYRNKLYGNLDGAAFYDIGTATDHFGTPLNQGAGLGLVYNSVIGPIKFYVASTVNQPKVHKGFYFSIGPEF